MKLSPAMRRAISLSMVDGGQLRRLREGMWSNSQWVSKHDPRTFVRTATITRLVDLGMAEYSAWTPYQWNRITHPTEVTLMSEALR